MYRHELGHRGPWHPSVPPSVHASGTLTVFGTVNGVKTQNVLAITVTPPTLTVTAAPASVQGPDSVTFTAAATPASITWNLSSWSWTPDSGFGGISTYCNWNEKACKRLISRSGWHKASATIGEYALVDSVHVTVTPPVFKVTASPTNIPSAQSVTFTATVTPSPPNGWNLSTWTWRPDTGTGGIDNYCSWTEKTCARTISKSGWMKGTTIIGQYTLNDSAHVSVGTCDATVLTMIGEYETFQVNLHPTCPDFTNTGGTAHFSWSALNGNWAQGNPHNPWGMVRAALTTGLEATRTNYNRGEIRLSSGYRCPHGNDSVGGATNSFHMHGRAGDMYSVDHPWTEDEFNLLKAAADETSPAPIESFNWDTYPNDRHYHAAW